MQKRAQISWMLIVGIALIILFLIGMAYVNKKDKISEKELMQNVQPVEQFIEQCLFETSVKGLDLLGRQGGVLYVEQGGVANMLYATDGYSLLHKEGLNEDRVFYSILPGGIEYQRSCSPENVNESFFDYLKCPSPSYPFISFEDSRVDLDPLGFDSPPLKNSRIMNTLNLPGLFPKDDIYSELEYSFQLTNAQHKITNSYIQFIKNNLDNCLNFSSLKENFKIKELGEKEIEPNFALDSTEVSMTWPLEITYKPTKQKVKLKEFNIRSNIRFGKIYKYIRDILYKEATDFSYDLSEAEAKEFDGITMNLIKDVMNQVDLVVFKDENSEYVTKDGFKQFEFKAAIPNSAPVLPYFFTNISEGFNLGLKSSLLNCDTFGSNNPFSDDDTLKINLGNWINRDTFECIFEAYSKSKGEEWQSVYDADSDLLTWDFKTAIGDWGEDVKFTKDSDFVNNPIQLRVSDGMYYDYTNFSIGLKNHGPKIIDFSFKSQDDDYRIYDLIVEDPEVSFGEEFDIVTIKVTCKGRSVDNGPDTSVNGLIWEVWVENSPIDPECTIYVEDYFGEHDEQTYIG